MRMSAMKANVGNLSIIQNTCPNPTWFEDFMQTYNTNLEKGEGTYFLMKIRTTGFGTERLFFSAMTESKFHETFSFTADENPRYLVPVTPK